MKGKSRSLEQSARESLRSAAIPLGIADHIAPRGRVQGGFAPRCAMHVESSPRCAMRFMHGARHADYRRVESHPEGGETLCHACAMLVLHGAECNAWHRNDMHGAAWRCEWYVLSAAPCCARRH